MNSALQKLMPLVLCLAAVACDVGAKDAARCAILAPPVSNARILNAIQDGKMQTLVDCGLHPDQGIPVAGDVVTPLQFAASSGKPELIRQVIRAGANPNFAGTGDGELPPLELVLSTRKYEAASVLLELGARADYVMPYTKVSALMSLAFDDRPGNLAGRMAEDLIKKGAAVNAADAKGNTPLHWGARAGNADYAKTLLKHGADACARNQKGERPGDVVKTDKDLRQVLAQACEAQAGGARR
jgi:ankyrin repeat protein